MTTLMIYGATGYTGRLASEHAKAAGLDLVIAGRDASKIADLAASLGGLTHRAFALDPDDPDDSQRRTLAAALAGTAVLLNCAGPYQRTAAPLMRACLAAGVHYLDVAAEPAGYRLAEALDRRAQAAAVMLLPGCGGSVALLGCLAGRAAAVLGGPGSGPVGVGVVGVDVALRVAGPVSRGSVASAAAGAGAGRLQRRGGRLVALEAGDGDGDGGVLDFDFGDGAGPVACLPVTLPDLVTIGRSTGAADVRTFVHVAGANAFPAGDVAALPEGPTAAERAVNPYHAAVRVEGADGSVGRAVLHTVNGYTFTAVASVEAARRVLAGEARAGFQTPAGLFGPGFAETILGTKVIVV